MLIRIAEKNHFSLHFYGRVFEKFVFLGPEIFPKFSEKGPKIPQISKSFIVFLKIEKTIIFASKLVQNHHINLNLAKFSPKTPKSANFHIKPLDFSNF